METLLTVKVAMLPRKKRTNLRTLLNSSLFKMSPKRMKTARKRANKK